MEKEKIIEIIENNPNLSYEEMKKDALQAGMSEQDFNECYKKNRATRIKKNILFIILIIGTTVLLLTSKSTYSLVTGVILTAFYGMLIYGNNLAKFLAIIIPFILIPLFYFLMSAIGAID